VELPVELPVKLPVELLVELMDRGPPAPFHDGGSTR
jgi:hypothetical protein